jgi:hypothetical protein
MAGLERTDLVDLDSSRMKHASIKIILHEFCSQYVLVVIVVIESSFVLYPRYVVKYLPCNFIREFMAGFIKSRYLVTCK